MLNSDIFFYSLLGGIIPALFWLKFWLKEDNHNEPRGLILGTFIAGMFSVVAAIFLEHAVTVYVENYTALSLFLWAGIEELVKFFAAYTIALRTRFINEPIDALIYLITAALGFAAIENTLFLIDPISKGSILTGLVTANLRFVGASLLHVLASGVIGLAMGYAFYKNKYAKNIILISGILLAILLHTVFNYLIISFDSALIFVFSGVWVGIILVLLIIEKIKRIKKLQN